MIYRVSIDAFALTPEVADVLKAVRDDRVFAKSRVTVYPGGLAAAAGHYADKPTPQVVVVEDEGDAQGLLDRLARLAEVCEPGTRVVVVGGLNDIALYRTLIGQGVSDYLLRPVAARQVKAALSAIFDDPAATARGKVTAFWGVRGGTGASTLAQNCAWAMGRALREDVIYIDLDVAFGTSVLAFNLDAKQNVLTALSHPDRLDQTLLERFLVAYGDTLQVLASPGDPRLAGPVEVDAVDTLLELASRMAPAVVVDLPHLWTGWTEHVLGAADEVVLVATPDLCCLRDAKTMLDLLGPKRGEGGGARLVLNRFDASPKTRLAAKDFEETTGFAPALILPFEPQLFGQAANNGQMLGEALPGHRVVEMVGGFAAALLGQKVAAKAPAKPRPRLLRWLMKEPA